MPNNSTYKIKWYYQLLVKLVIWVFKKVFNISANIPNEVININKPYLLLANHYGRYDPFIISDFIKNKPNFVSSDAILRYPVIGQIFKGLGAIPKQKGVRDTQVIREMKRVIDTGGAIGLFPEATRTWSGVTHFIDPSIAKLARLLNVPVVTAKMKGAYAFDPRWAKPLRRAKVVIDYKIAISKKELGQCSETEIMLAINTGLYHDDIDYLRKEKIKIKSNKRAECINRMLFQCPGCNSYEGFVSTKNEFNCLACNYKVYVNTYGFFEADSLKFDNPRDWLSWQNKNWVKHIGEQLEVHTQTPLFQAQSMEIYASDNEGMMAKQGVGTVSFFSDHIQIECEVFNRALLHKDITSLSPQFKESIELFYLDKAYRFVGIKHIEPGIKWELAINAVWNETGEEFKLSPYFKELFEG